MRKWLLCVVLVAFVMGLVSAGAGADKITVVQAYPAGFVAAPFIYSGVTYVPLRSVASVIGAALLWDSVRNRAVLTFNGREFGLVIGSPTFYLGPQVVVLPAAPIIVGGVVFVPQVFIERELKVPVESGHGFIRIKGHEGWREMRFRAAPSARYISGWGGKRSGPLGGRPPRVQRMGKPSQGPKARRPERGRTPFQVSPGPGGGKGGGKPEKYGQGAGPGKGGGKPEKSGPGRGGGKGGKGQGKGHGRGGG